MQPEAVATMPLNPSGVEREIARQVETRIGEKRFELCFRDKTSFCLQGDEVVVGVSSPFVLTWMQKRFRESIVDAARETAGPSVRVSFRVDARLVSSPQAVDRSVGRGPEPFCETAPPQPVEQVPSVVRQIADALPVASRGGEQKRSDAGPAPSRSGRRFADLADFVAGTCNDLALAAARKVCDAPGEKFNPLFLHGTVGTGKTHVLEGIYRTLRKQHPHLQVMFLTAEAFTNYFTQAYRDHTLPSFRQRFRNVDVLLVDDVDFLDSKRVIEEEFLHTFKQLESHGRQIVVTADRHPRLLNKLGEELVTRFLSGLVCRIEAPDFDTRLKILQRKASRMEADFAPDALAQIAERFPHSIRELEGALNCLETYASMSGRRVSRSAARQVLAELERDCVRIIRAGDVERAICNFFRIDSGELKSASRERTVSQPRMLGMYLMRKHTQAAYREIGQFFGGRNHSTVMAAERKVKRGLLDRERINVASQKWLMSEVLELLEQQLYAS